MVGDGDGASRTAIRAATTAAAASGGGGGASCVVGVGGITRYRSRLLPSVDGGDLVALLAKQDTVRRGHCCC